MILTLILCLTTSIFLTLPKINNPLSITLIIIFIALITALIFCTTLSSWYAFLIFLIYVGGILVIFAYFTATSPNQQQISMKKIMYYIVVSFIITLSLLLSRRIIIPLTPAKSHQLIRLFISHNIYSLIIITLILLLTIVIVVKLASRSKGPLRTFIT